MTAEDHWKATVAWLEKIRRTWQTCPECNAQMRTTHYSGCALKNLMERAGL